MRVTVAAMRVMFLAGVIGVLGAVSDAGAQAHPTLPPCSPGDRDLLLPDLIPELPASAGNVYRAGARAIEFTTSVGNIGDGPLIVEGITISESSGLMTQAFQIIRRRDGSECAREAGRFVFHDRHRHWHFDRFVTYELRADDPIDGRVVAGGTKTTYCLMDTGMLRGYGPVRYPPQVDGSHCGPDGLQGISVGWKDVYPTNYAGQWVDLDRTGRMPVPLGAYYLTNVVDPDELLWDRDRSNNTSFVSVSVTLKPPPPGSIIAPVPTPRGVRPPRVKPTRRPRPTVRPKPTRVPRERPAPRATRTPRPDPRATPQPSRASGCESACQYHVSQLRMTWYHGTGLNLSGTLGAGGCQPLTPDAGERARIVMENWLTHTGADTGNRLAASFDLTERGPSGSTKTGSMQFGKLGDAWRFGVNLKETPFATGADGMNFPVVFDACLTVGGQAVPLRLVCQPKSTGMLCHE